MWELVCIYILMDKIEIQLARGQAAAEWSFSYFRLKRSLPLLEDVLHVYKKVLYEEGSMYDFGGICSIHALPCDADFRRYVIRSLRVAATVSQGNKVRAWEHELRATRTSRLL
jgi:hypothetical protein